MINNPFNKKILIVAIIVVTVILLLLILIIIGMNNKSTGFLIKNEENKKIKVGAIVSLTGKDSYFGEVIQKGMLLANKDNSIDLFMEDFGSETKNSPTAVNKLIEINNIDILLTEFSEDTLGSIEIIKQKKIPTICIGCGSAGITKESEYLFRVWPSDEIEVSSLVNFAKEKNFKRVAILQTNSVWEETLTEAFQKKWDNDILIEKANREDNDFKTQLVKIKSFNPDFIYLACYEQKYPLILKQLRELGINSKIGTTSWINDPTILKACNKNCDNLIVPQYAQPSQDFILEYKQKYGEEPGLGADVAYDAIKIISKIDSKNKEEILKKLLITKYSGASGEIEFDENRDRKNRKVDLYMIKNMQLQKIN